METVGVVGFGAMGTALAERLQDTSGEAPLIFDIALAARERAAAAGLEVADSLHEIGERCDVIDVIVADDEQVLAATTGPDGVLHTARSGTIVLLHSSIAPGTSIEVGDTAGGRGVAVADACASGTPRVIREGQLVFLLGASEELAERVRPHLLRMARGVIRMGPLGSGNVAKLMKNFVQASERIVLWEMLQLGEAAGISYVDALEMMRFVASDHESVAVRWEQWFDPSGDDPLLWHGGELYGRVVPSAVTLAHSYGVELPVAEELAAAALRLRELNAARSWTPR